MNEKKWSAFSKEVTPLTDLINEVRKKYGIEHFMMNFGVCTDGKDLIEFTYHESVPGQHDSYIYSCAAFGDKPYKIGMLGESAYATMPRHKNSPAAGQARRD